MDSQPDKLDQLIDGALASYADAEPLAGLEERVLNRARVARAGGRRVLAWTVGLAIAASVAMVGIVVRSERQVAPKAMAPAAVKTQVVPAPEIQRAVRVRRVVRARRARALPKLEQFPAPSPMTAEERALVAFVVRDPEEALQTFSELQTQTYEPIKIQPIRIAPLEEMKSSKEE